MKKILSIILASMLVLAALVSLSVPAAADSYEGSWDVMLSEHDKELDDEDTYYLFGYEEHNELMELYEKERQYIARLFEQIAADYGFIRIRCIGHFYNGEALYEEVKA